MKENELCAFRLKFEYFCHGDSSDIVVWVIVCFAKTTY